MKPLYKRTGHDDIGTVTTDLFTMLMMLFAVMMVVVASMLRTPIGQQLIELLNQVTQLTTERDDAQSESSQWKSEASDLKQQVAEVESQRKEAREDAEEWEQRTIAQATKTQQLNTELAQSKSNAAASAQENQMLKKEVEHTKSARDNALREAANLQTKPVDVVLVLDGTSSMDPILQELATSVKSVAEIGSRLSPKFRLGIVIYRGKENIAIFPLTEIKQTVGGVPSEGMRSLTKFTDEKTKRLTLYENSKNEVAVTPLGKSEMFSEMKGLFAYADIEGGVRSGVSMLSQSNTQETRKVLILMGDIGPWESDGNPADISSTDQQSAARTVSLIKKFDRSNRFSKALMLFTGKNMLDIKHRAQTMDFFRSLAVSAGSGGSYSDDASAIAAAVIEAVVGK